jgi:hypothetical protein
MFLPFNRRTIAACFFYDIKPFVCQIAPKLVWKTLTLSYAVNEGAQGLPDEK